MRDRGKTYHHNSTTDRDRVTCFKIGLPLMLIAGKSKERLARYTTWQVCKPLTSRCNSCSRATRSRVVQVQGT